MAYGLAQNVVIGPESVGVAITHGLLGTHLGLAYPEEDGSTKLLHLAWHKQLRVDEYPQQNWLASIMQIPPIASSQAVALLRGMAEKYGNNRNSPDSFDYGINLLAGPNAIKGDGTYAPEANCDGYTCASIIAEVLRKSGFELIKLSTWKSTPRNAAWGRAIICLLRATQTPDSHVKRVEANINGLRLRPEEVAAAAELPAAERPSEHDAIQKRADEIAEQVQTSCGPPPESGGAFKLCIDAYQAEIAQLKDTGNKIPDNSQEQLAG
jgi:hypothetical protein